ncbi:hypothetical protein C8A05DRAFT_12588, partial [Staphylotrichum tortipilum]
VLKLNLASHIGQGFAIVGVAIAKSSLGFFLLRLVTVFWHRIAIWTAMTLVTLASIAQVLCFWLSCVPLNYVYDRRIPGGYCPIDTRPTSYILCISTILVDFFFAVFPWIIVWPLQMPQREKYTIAGSMSLGLIAAAAGIKRTTEVEGLYTPNYLKDSVGLIVWSSAEMAVTLICIGIPVCRPLYKRAFRRLFGETGNSSTHGYQKQSRGIDGSNSVPLRTIGGGMIGPDGVPISSAAARKQGGVSGHTTDKDAGEGSDDNISFREVKIGVNGPFTRTTVGRGRRGSADQGSSDEEILGDEFRRSQIRGASGGEEERETVVSAGAGASRGGAGQRGILVTESYRVERT